MAPARYTIHETRDIDTHAAAVWERISKHAQTHTWVKGARVTLLSPGLKDENGVDAVRQVSFPDQPKWPSIDERITAFEAGKTFSYQIIRGAMPGLVYHLGTLTLEALGPGKSRLTWHIIFDFKWWHPARLIAPGFLKTFGGIIGGALAELGSQLKSHAATA